MEFPRLVYLSASQYSLVEDELEYSAALAAGWHASVPEALEANAVIDEEDVPAESIPVAPRRRGRPSKAE